jgi:uncharacterized repeat protein (TIGR03803 family)
LGSSGEKMRQPRLITRPFPKRRTVAVVLASLLMSAVVATQSMQAQTLRTLHAFHGPDGETPFASLIRDSAGNLYGTALEGGTSSYFGTVFKLDKHHKLTVLYNFAGKADGADPQSTLLRDAKGNLYGTTPAWEYGEGVVYKIDPSGTETVLHVFGGSDGSNPFGSLVQDKSGNLYGTSSSGGTFGAGTVFKLDTNGELTTLYTFTGGADGGTATGSMVRDAAGNLYGTCQTGGSAGFGTVYKLHTTGKLTVLHSFNGTDGAFPYGGVIADAAGSLYGTTDNGSSMNNAGGTVFRVEESTGSFTSLHSFDGTGAVEGDTPYGTLARDSGGNLYGANYAGGGGSCGSGGCGTIWKLDTNNQLTVLTNFGKGYQGKSPKGGVVVDKAGNLYGTTSLGAVCRYCGTVFKIAP